MQVGCWDTVVLALWGNVLVIAMASMHSQSVMEVGEVGTLLILDAEEVSVVICLLHFPTITLPQVRGYPMLR